MGVDRLMEMEGPAINVSEADKERAVINTVWVNRDEDRGVIWDMLDSLGLLPVAAKMRRR